MGRDEIPIDIGVFTSQQLLQCCCPLPNLLPNFVLLRDTHVVTPAVKSRLVEGIFICGSKVLLSEGMQLQLVSGFKYVAIPCMHQTCLQTFPPSGPA